MSMQHNQCHGVARTYYSKHFLAFFENGIMVAAVHCENKIIIKSSTIATNALLALITTLPHTSLYTACCPVVRQCCCNRRCCAAKFLFNFSLCRCCVLTHVTACLTLSFLCVLLLLLLLPLLLSVQNVLQPLAVAGAVDLNAVDLDAMERKR